MLAMSLKVCDVFTIIHAQETFLTVTYTNCKTWISDTTVQCPFQMINEDSFLYRTEKITKVVWKYKANYNPKFIQKEEKL